MGNPTNDIDLSQFFSDIKDEVRKIIHQDQTREKKILEDKLNNLKKIIITVSDTLKKIKKTNQVCFDFFADSLIMYYNQITQFIVNIISRKKYISSDEINELIIFVDKLILEQNLKLSQIRSFPKNFE